MTIAEGRIRWTEACSEARLVLPSGGGMTLFLCVPQGRS